GDDDLVVDERVARAIRLLRKKDRTAGERELDGRVEEDLTRGGGEALEMIVYEHRARGVARRPAAAVLARERGDRVVRRPRLIHVLCASVGEEVAERLARRVVVGLVLADAQVTGRELGAGCACGPELLGARVDAGKGLHPGAERLDVEEIGIVQMEA